MTVLFQLLLPEALADFHIAGAGAWAVAPVRVMFVQEPILLLLLMQMDVR